MKKVRELLNTRRRKLVAGGVSCFVAAALILSLTSELGVQAEEITIGAQPVTFNTEVVEGNTVYLVESAEQLQMLGKATGTETEGKIFRLKNDITVTSVTSPATGTFAGIFDGNGHVILYSDIDITVTDVEPTSESKVQGVLFGKVSGTVQNLIIDVEDEDAAYTRNTKNEAVGMAGEPEYEEDPIIDVTDGTVSGLDEQEWPAVQNLLSKGTLEENGKTYRVHTEAEDGQITTVYSENLNPGTDYFGLLCGENTGTVTEVYVTGKDMSITRTEEASKEHSKYVQSGKGNVTYYYEQGTDSEEENGTVTVSEGKDTSTDRNIGLKATLNVNGKSISGNNITGEYTLTLENTKTVAQNSGIISHDVAITTELNSAWVLDTAESTAADFATTKVIPAGKIVVYKKSLNTSVEGENPSVGSYNEQITLQGKLTSTVYTFTYNKSEPVSNSFVASGNPEADVSSEPIASGNYLYGGGITGRNAGTVSKVKQVVDLTGAEVAGEFLLGGIAGEHSSGASWSDLYLLGTAAGSSKYDGSGSGSPSRSAKSEAEAAALGANSESWASYTKYSQEAESGVIASTFADLAWLVKADAFSYTTDAESNQIKVTVSAPKTSQPLDYSVAYNARRSLADASEDSIYLSVDGNLVLGDSGYYRQLSAYATDGYYHYNTAVSGLAQAEMVYPHRSDAPISIDENGYAVIRSTNPLDDKIQVTLSPADGLNGTIYYNINDMTTVPNTADNSNRAPANLANGQVLLPFQEDSVAFRLVPVVDGYIYPSMATKDFKLSDKEPLPVPEIFTYNYYASNGNKNEYQPFVPNTTFDAGTDMLFEPKEDLIDSYSFRYLYSTTAPVEEEWDEAQRYTGGNQTSFARNFASNALEYADSAVIPKSLLGDFERVDNVYLYVEISKKSYSTEIYCYGPFTVVKGAELTANVPASDGYTVITGDVVTLEGNPEGTTIQYHVSDLPMTSFSSVSWKNYGTSGIIMNQNMGGYIYARIQYNSSKYSEVFSFPCTFGGVCADPNITPNTGVGTGVSTEDEVAAATVTAATSISLASRTPGANIFYLASDNVQEITLDRILLLPKEDMADGEVYENYKYFQVGNRWYRTTFTDVLRYSEGFYLNNETREAKLVYVSAVALADGYEPSANLKYVYKVQPPQQVENPEAAFETRHTPGGESLETTSVTLGTKISFYSVTPGAELYYCVGSSAEEPTELMATEGVTVTGEYGGNFVVRLQAKKQGMLDSEIVTFVYTIAEQEKASMPTATPGTTADVPTVVIPGNKILLSSATKEASIFYTTDGTSPVVVENADGSFSGGNDATLLYDPNNGIEMPMDSSGYFSITAVAVKADLAKSTEVHFAYSYPAPVLAPYANLDSGKVEKNAVVFLKNLTEEAVIYYNVAYGDLVPDDPTLSSSVFSEEYPFTISQKMTIKAMAAKDGVKSTIVTFTFEPMEQLAAPTASIESGSVVARGTVLELKAATGATIFYTMDGSDPTDSSNQAVIAGNTLTLNGEAGGQITIKAYAAATGSSSSEVVTFTYQFSPNTAGVTASIESGSTVSNGTKVNLMSDVTDGVIYYTTDGSSPVKYGIKGTTVEINGTPGTSYTVKAVVVVNGEPGTIATFIYRIKERPTAPTASPSGGTLTVAARVSLSSSGEKIYYTTDGTTPTESSLLYAEPILINRTTTLKAIAVSEDGEISEIATHVYTAAKKAAEVISSQEDGTVLEPGDTITLSTATQNAVIYYSTDGTVPTANNLDSMLEYDGEPIEINRSVTIQAVAYRKDLRLSNVKTWNYIVEIIPAVEQKAAEAAKLAEESLRNTDASELERNSVEPEITVDSTVYEKEYNTSVSYSSEALPEKVELETTKNDNNPYTTKMVKEIFGDDTTVLESYKVKVKDGSFSFQPKEKVEVAFQIPSGYEDATLSVAMITDDYKLTTLETRREADMLYAKTEKLGSYVIVGPEREAETEKDFPYLILLEIATGLTLVGGLAFYVKEKLKKSSKKR